MNRPKFRVWDIEEQKWYKPTYKAYMNELHDIHIYLDGRLLIRTIDESGKCVTIHESMFEGRYELLQSTGLKDKNGTEIYEGDIVECYTEGLSTVEFEHGCFGLLCNGYFEGFVNVLGKIEIVGNIYEHPHLLGEDAQ